MSFEKLNETSISNIHDRSCVIIVNANKKESAMKQTIVHSIIRGPRVNQQNSIRRLCLLF